jgi:hypothetical protein
MKSTKIKTASMTIHGDASKPMQFNDKIGITTKTEGCLNDPKASVV